MKDVILDKIYLKRREGIKPTHLIVSIDMFKRIKMESDPLLRDFLPAEYTKDLSTDSFLGLVVSILSNSDATDYVEVV